MMKTCLETLLEIVVTAGLADFLAGFVHWFEDAYVREDTPVIGKLVGRPNVIHHHLPRHFTRFNWWHSSRDLLLISGLIVAGAWGLGWLTWQVWLFALVSANANEIHKWAHRTRRENGFFISFLQDARVLQTPRHHAIHHTNPKNCHYCPVTNLVNPILDFIRFWDALEWFLARTIGLCRRPDTSLPNGEVPAWIKELRSEGEAVKTTEAPAPAKTAPQSPCAQCGRCKQSRDVAPVNLQTLRACGQRLTGAALKLAPAPK